MAGLESTFQYRPLDPNQENGLYPIRFIKLYPAKSHDADIVCEIFHSRLDDKKRSCYEALSYSWGIPKPTSTIQISYAAATTSPSGLLPDARQKQSLEVRLNLEMALRYLRWTDKERILWIDAICINQGDAPEKNFQVAQMRHVYLESKSVAVWLGEEGTAREAMKWCERLLNDSLKGDVQLGSYLSEENTPKWLVCDDLFLSRPYWSRMWILQEVIHTNAVEFYMGSYKSSCEGFLEAFSKYYEIKITLLSIANSASVQYEESSSPEEKARRLANDMWVRTASTGDLVLSVIKDLRPRFQGPAAVIPRLGGLLRTFRDQESENPKDKIYALLGMVQQEYQIPIEYDDSKISVAEVYTTTARQLLVKVLLVLYWVESPYREISASSTKHGLPSWVPDFTQDQHVAAMCKQSTWAYFSADDGLLPGSLQETNASTQNESRCFRIRGVRVGFITGTFVSKLVENWSTEGRWKEAAVIKLIRCYLHGADAAVDGNWPGEASWENTSWGPCMAEVGDVIVVAQGAKIPLVLRKHAVEGYLFVGMCWLIEERINVKSISESVMAEKNIDNLNGFSRLMFGEAANQLGKTYQMEEFLLY